MTSTGVVLRLDGERWNFHPSPTGHTRHIRHTVRTAANLQVRDLHAVLAGALGSEGVRKRVWVQNVAVSASLLEAKLNAVDVRLQGDERTEAEPLLEGVRVLLGRARDAAYRDNPIPTKWASWWRGTLIEAAYQNLHAAEALIVRLYSDDEVAAEVPEVIARVESGLNRDDPRRVSARRVMALPPGPSKRAEVSKLVEIGYAAGDMQHSRLRSFRNTTLVSAGILALFLLAFVVGVSRFPTAVPFCFQPTRDGPLYCPTGSSVPSSGDVWVISLLGLLGGALAAAVSIRNIRGT